MGGAKRALARFGGARAVVPVRDAEVAVERRQPDRIDRIVMDCAAETRRNRREDFLPFD